MDKTQSNDYFQPKYARGGRLPVPATRKCANKDKRENALKFFEYWAGIEAEMVDFVLVKIYRTFPLIDFRLVEPDRKTITTAEVAGAIPFKPDEYKEWFVDQFGHGGWRCILTDTSAQGGLVCEALFEAPGNLDNQQAKIDLRTLIRSNTRNQEYIRQLQARNVKMPWDDPKENEDVASNDALKTVTDTVVRLAEKNIEATEAKAAAEVEAARSQGPSSESIATNKSIEIVSDTANKMIDMVTSHAGNNFDPLALVREVGTMMQTARGEQAPPAGLDLTQVLALIDKANDRAAQAQQAQMNLILETIKTSREERALVPAAPVEAPKSFQAQLTETLDLLDRLKGFRGGASREEIHSEPREPAKTLPQQVMENLPLIMGGLTLFGVLMYNMRAKPGEPLKNPMEELQRAQTMPFSNTGMPMPGAAPMPGAPQPAPMPGANPNPLQRWAQLLPQIEKPFLAHFYGGHQGLGGFTFAEFIMSNGTGGAQTPEGRAAYIQIREGLGPREDGKIIGCPMDQILRQYPPIWNQVQGVLPLYEKFLAEFFSYDEAAQDQQDPEPPPAKAAKQAKAAN